MGPSSAPCRLILPPATAAAWKESLQRPITVWSKNRQGGAGLLPASLPRPLRSPQDGSEAQTDVVSVALTLAAERALGALDLSGGRPPFAPRTGVLRLVAERPVAGRRVLVPIAGARACAAVPGLASALVAGTFAECLDDFLGRAPELALDVALASLGELSAQLVGSLANRRVLCVPLTELARSVRRRSTPRYGT